MKEIWKYYAKKKKQKLKTYKSSCKNGEITSTSFDTVANPSSSVSQDEKISTIAASKVLARNN